MVGISIVVPCYNEEKIIFNTYKEIKKEIEKITQKDYEIIFANDGSEDNTERVLKEISRKDGKVKVISWWPNKGPGYASRQLYKNVSGDIVIQMDADLSVGPTIFKKFIKELGNADMIIASRYEGIKANYPLYRWLVSRVYYIICEILFNLRIKDLQSGFFAFNGDIIDSIELKSSGFEINVELFAKIKKKGYKIKEIPTKFIHRKEGEYNILKKGPFQLFETFKIWRELKKK
jgi:glycosyltransferase involved in cell wall biosynthesis